MRPCAVNWSVRVVDLGMQALRAHPLPTTSGPATLRTLPYVARQFRTRERTPLEKVAPNCSIRISPF